MENLKSEERKGEEWERKEKAGESRVRGGLRKEEEERGKLRNVAILKSHRVC